MEKAVAKLEKQIDYFTTETAVVERYIRTTNSKIGNQHRTFEHELARTREKFAMLKRDINTTKEKLRTVIKLLQRTASAGDLEVLKKKADHWSPEHFVQKDEFKRMLER